MKHTWRFLFGCALGIGAGYALTLLLSPGRASEKPRRFVTPSSDNATGENS